MKKILFCAIIKLVISYDVYCPKLECDAEKVKAKGLKDNYCYSMGTTSPQDTILAKECFDLSHAKPTDT